MTSLLALLTKLRVSSAFHNKEKQTCKHWENPEGPQGSCCSACSPRRRQAPHKSTPSPTSGHCPATAFPKPLPSMMQERRQEFLRRRPRRLRRCSTAEKRRVSA